MEKIQHGDRVEVHFANGGYATATVSVLDSGGAFVYLLDSGGVVDDWHPNPPIYPIKVKLLKKHPDNVRPQIALYDSGRSNGEAIVAKLNEVIELVNKLSASK
jgi:hypothetical protein